MIKIPDKLTNETVITGKVPPHMKDRYTVRCKEATAKTSKSASGNFMIDFECEIVKPLIKEFGGQKYALDSLEIHYYGMLRIYTDGELDLAKTDQAIRKIIGGHEGDRNCLHGKLGLPNSIDDENPDVSIYKGLVFDAIISSRERVAQKPNGKGGYENILDDNGKPITQGWELNCQLDDVLGLSKAEIPASGF